MRKKRAAAIPSLLFFILLGALAVYGECAQAANHPDLAAEHEASLNHCPDVFLISNGRAASAIQFHNGNLKALPSIISEKIDSVVSRAWFKDHPFWEPFSQQGLFRLEEVYRL